MNSLDDAIAAYERRGYRLDMIMPADAPRVAVVSNAKEMLRLVATDGGVQAEPFLGLGHPVIPPSSQEFVITRVSAPAAWITGRAGLQYRDLIPGRLGGRYIASHIRITEGGPVGDYVHHHRVRFQIIFVRKGWVRVVYEDQGPPFVMHEGDCVLQPPGIRHRVLESSPGLEVIEIGCPAEHETFRDHELSLPTATLNPKRNFDGQHFVHHIAADAPWQQGEGFEFRDTGIAKATNNLAGVRIVRPRTFTRTHNGDFLFLSVLKGRVKLAGTTLGEHTLEADDACTIPSGADYTLTAEANDEILEVALPAR
ncbi:MAG: cupin domain-containing protein [Alphaproteobacteria bacterium]|nr:cupin domain-containing protein [Alphaproteobacteria bacterium]